MKNVFEFNDYKLYLVAVEESRKTYERGFRSKLAKVLGCQSGYHKLLFRILLINV